MTLPNIPPHLLEYKLNPKAFINAHNFPNLESLLQEVIRIDTDEKAYQAMLQEPIFLDNFNPFSYYEKRLFDFFDSIFSQEPQKAFRRGKGQIMQQYQTMLEENMYFGHFVRQKVPYIMKYKKTLQIFHALLTLPYQPRRFFRYMKAKMKKS